MVETKTIMENLQQQGISRRAFLQFCTLTASLLALPPGAARAMAAALATQSLPTVIWQQFQECTGCTESFTRSFQPTLENLMLSQISLDYHETLFAAAGAAAETAREHAVSTRYGQYILIVEGSIPMKTGYYVKAGRDGMTLLSELMAGAACVLAVGTCASFGGIPKANPNPSDARSVNSLIQSGYLPSRPLVNIAGCPPIPEVITGVITYYLTYRTLPSMDSLKRPRPYYQTKLHSICPRRETDETNSFDSSGARKGYCLEELGCKGPETYNACLQIKWNKGVSNPINSGHGCIGCSEPDFWDKRRLYEEADD